MKIAVTSQNRRSVTNHAGRCRRFWIFDIEGGQVQGQTLIELDKGGSLHDIAPDIPESLQSVDRFVTAGLCENMKRRLQRAGIEARTTHIQDPIQAALDSTH
jgi:predicted Fe-Mo cluster-binding NifX family protein